MFEVYIQYKFLDRKINAIIINHTIAYRYLYKDINIYRNVKEHSRALLLIKNGVDIFEKMFRCSKCSLKP